MTTRLAPGGSTGSVETLRMLEYTLHLDVECPRILRDLRRIYRRFRLEGSNNDSPDGKLTVRVSSRSGGEFAFVVEQDGEMLCEITKEDMVVPFIVWRISIWITRQISDTHYLIHGAMASQRDWGILLPGSRGAGKTSLLMALIMDGFACVADDMIFINPMCHTVLSFPAALTVRYESFQRLLDGGRDVDWYTSAIEQDRVTFVDPTQIRRNSIGASCLITHVVVPEYDKNIDTSLKQISKRDTLIELYRCSRNFDRFGSRGIDILQSVVEHADCYRLTTSNIEPEPVNDFETLSAKV